MITTTEKKQQQQQQQQQRKKKNKKQTNKKNNKKKQQYLMNSCTRVQIRSLHGLELKIPKIRTDGLIFAQLCHVGADEQLDETAL